MTLLTAAGRKTALLGFTGSDFRAATSNSGAFPSSNSLVLDRPAGTVDGDLLVATVMVGDATAVTPPSGWAELSGSPKVLPDASRIHAYSKVASSEPSTWTWGLATGNDWSVVVASYAGVVADAVREVFASGGGSGLTTITAPSVTTDAANELVVYFLGADGPRTLSPAEGSNNLRLQDHPLQTTAAIADEFFASAGATGTRDFALNASANAGAIVAAFSKVA